MYVGMTCPCLIGKMICWEDKLCRSLLSRRKKSHPHQELGEVIWGNDESGEEWEQLLNLNFMKKENKKKIYYQPESRNMTVWWMFMYNWAASSKKEVVKKNLLTVNIAENWNKTMILGGCLFWQEATSGGAQSSHLAQKLLYSEITLGKALGTIWNVKDWIQCERNQESLGSVKERS